MPATNTKGVRIRQPHEPITLAHIKARSIEEGDCWLWQGAQSKGCAPVIGWGGRPVGVRRHIAEHIQGKRVNGLLASTCCGNQRCVAPAHISMKTRKQLQMATAALTGYAANMDRRVRISNAKRATAKLNEEIAREIRYADGSQRAIAKRFGVSFDTVNKIKRGLIWREYSSPWAGLFTNLKA